MSDRPSSIDQQYAYIPSKLKKLRKLRKNELNLIFQNVNNYKDFTKFCLY